MSLASAKKFLEKTLSDESFAKQMRSQDPSNLPVAAREFGFEFTEEELQAAVNEYKKRPAKTESPRELSLDELDNVAGGRFWQGEDAPDGHEMGCFAYYYRYNYSFENNTWCVSEYYCQKGRYKDDTIPDDYKWAR